MYNSYFKIHTQILIFFLIGSEVKIVTYPTPWTNNQSKFSSNSKNVCICPILLQLSPILDNKDSVKNGTITFFNISGTRSRTQLNFIIMERGKQDLSIHTNIFLVGLSFVNIEKMLVPFFLLGLYFLEQHGKEFFCMQTFQNISIWLR